MLAYDKLNNINAKVGIYLRISLEDGDKRESNSIENQRKIIYEYLHKNNFTNYKEFIDDGATGTNFNRKGFQELLVNIENGNINTVITKDFSRIGRNYVKTGYYIEDYFLNKGVRYISVLDRIDTYTDVMENELLPFKAILNDMYSRDISLKQKSSLIERKKRGRYIACFAPYGYKKNKEIKGNLDIDEESADIVRYIFKSFLQGDGLTKIAKELTEKNVPTPAMHLGMKWNKDSIYYEIWKPSSVKKILRNETYLGHMIQNKETTVSHKNPKRIFLDKKDYIIIYNHHIPIINKEDFEKANSILDSKKRNHVNKREQTILHKYLYCGECGNRLSRIDVDNRIYYFCRTRTEFHLCDNRNSVSYVDIECKILNYIKDIIKKYSDKRKLQQVYLSNYNQNKTRIKEYNFIMNNYLKELTKINNKLDIIYNDKLNNLISVDMYKKYSTDLKNEQKILEEKICETKTLINKEENQIEILKNDKQKVKDLVKKFLNLEQINTEIIEEFIEKISIDKNRDFHINFNFRF